MTVNVKKASQGVFEILTVDQTGEVMGTVANPFNFNSPICRQMIGPFCQTNIAANQASVQIGLGANGASQVDAIMSRAGYVVAITASFTVAPAGSSLILKVFKNGVIIDATGILTVTTGASLRRTVTFTPNNALLAFAAGDALGIAVLTDGSWSATTSDVAAYVEVQTSL